MPSETDMLCYDKIIIGASSELFFVFFCDEVPPCKVSLKGVICKKNRTRRLKRKKECEPNLYGDPENV